MPVYTVSVELVDAYERMSRKTFRTVDLVDHAAAVTAAGALVTSLAAITEARILSYTVSERLTFVDTVDAGANKDEGLTMTVRKVNLFRDTLKVAAPINALFLSDGTLDQSHAGVNAYVAHFLTPTGNFTFSDGEQVVELVSGRLDK